MSALPPIAAAAKMLQCHERRDVPLAYQSGQPLSPFKIASDFDTVLVLNGSVSLRRSAECKGRSITFCVPTIFRAAIGLVGRCDGQAVFFSPPFEDILLSSTRSGYVFPSTTSHPSEPSSLTILGNTQALHE